MRGDLSHYVFRALGLTVIERLSSFHRRERVLDPNPVLFSVVAADFTEAHRTANEVIPGSVYLGLGGNLPGVARHPIAPRKCGHCGGLYRRGESCGCFDNGGQ